MVSSGEFASPTMVQRFHLEAEAAASLNHPNIVPIYETGECRGQHFFSMKLIEGTGLDSYFTAGGFSVGTGSGADKASQRNRQEKIASILIKVARAVDYAHQHGVLHRDIKPSNVLLDRHGEPHLTDFGLAKVLGSGDSSLTASGAIIGTPSYMAPEQAAGQNKSVSIASDIYSLGAVLYGMLTGHPPFRGETSVQTLKQVIEDEPKHPSTLNDGVDRDLASICLKCMEKQPARRYPAASALADDLERWQRGEPIIARPAGSGERFWRWCRRNPKEATLGASAFVLLVALSVGALLVAYRIKMLSDSVENNNRQLRNEVLDNLVKVYSDPSATRYVIKSAVRHSLVGQGPAKPDRGTPLELTAVEYGYEHPTNVLKIFSPILQKLEEKLSDRLKRPVLINLLLLQSYDLGYDALESGSLSFGRVGPASFSQLLNKGTGVRLVAMQDHKFPLTLAVFARTNGEVARILSERPDIKLAEVLSNRSMAFGNSNSTTGKYLAQWFLATNGVFANSLSRLMHFRTQRDVIDEVNAGRFDVGAGNREIVEDYPNLKVIAKLELADLGRCWVAGKGLNDEVFLKLRESLLELRDPAILDTFESEVVGFKMLDEQALNRLREIMQGAVAFDSRREQR